MSGGHVLRRDPPSSSAHPFFTVCTPTYQRAGLLPRVHESLFRQSFSSFEWIVVDDGSTDGTGELVATWARSRSLQIRYFRQPNRGKHVAINRGVRAARGELFVIVDSDDWLRPEALESIYRTWYAIPEDRKGAFAGVCGLCADPCGAIVGTRFPSDVLDSNSVEIRARHKVQGDNFGAIRVDVLAQFPFPEDLGSFVTEGLVWNRIAQHYKTRFVNEIWCVTDYQSIGLSATSVPSRVRSCSAARTYYEEFVGIDDLHIPFLSRLHGSANFVRFALHEGWGFRWQRRRMRGNPAWWPAIPVGCLLFLRDRLRLFRTTGVDR